MKENSDFFRKNSLLIKCLKIISLNFEQKGFWGRFDDRFLKF